MAHCIAYHSDMAMGRGLKVGARHGYFNGKAGHLNKAIGNTAWVVKNSPKDLAILRSNCHRMVHRSDPMLTVSELAGLVGNWGE